MFISGESFEVEKKKCQMTKYKSRVKHAQKLWDRLLLEYEEIYGFRQMYVLTCEAISL